MSPNKQEELDSSASLPKAKDYSKPLKKVAGKIYDRLGVFSIIIVLLIIGYFVSPRFFTSANLMNILRAVSILGMVAFGHAFVTYSGHLADLSVPAYMAFSGIIAVEALSLGFVPAIILGILAGVFIGVINGLVIGYLKANPILWTLAVVFAMEGFMRFTWSNDQVYPDLSDFSGRAFVSLFRLRFNPLPFLQIPFYVIIMFALFILCYFLMKKTEFGIYTKYIGSMREAAECAGINVRRTILKVYITVSFTCAIAGIFLASMNRFGVFYLGEGYDFQSVTAIVIGGVTLAGGRGSIFGVLGGVILIGLVRNILTHLGVGTIPQNIMLGIIFITVVGINSYYFRKVRSENE